MALFFGWEGNRRFGVVLAMRRSLGPLCGVSTGRVINIVRPLNSNQPTNLIGRPGNECNTIRPLCSLNMNRPDGYGDRQTYRRKGTSEFVMSMVVFPTIPSPADPELSCSYCHESSQVMSYYSYPTLCSLAQGHWTHRIEAPLTYLQSSHNYPTSIPS